MIWIILSLLFKGIKVQPPYAGLIEKYIHEPDYKMHRSNDHGVVDIEEMQLKQPYHPNYDKTKIQKRQEIFARQNAINQNLPQLLPVVNPGVLLPQNPINLHNHDAISQNIARNDVLSNLALSPLNLHHMSPLDLQQWSYSLSEKPHIPYIPLENYHILDALPVIPENNLPMAVLPSGVHSNPSSNSPVLISSPSKNNETHAHEDKSSSLHSSPHITQNRISTTPIALIKEKPKIAIDVIKSNKIDIRPPAIQTPLNPINALRPTVILTSNTKKETSTSHPYQNEIQHHKTHGDKSQHEKTHHDKIHDDKHHHSKNKKIPLEQLCPDYLTPLERQLCIELTNDANLTRQHKLAIVNQMQRERISRYAVDRCQWRGRDCQTCLMDLNCAFCPADNRCYDYSFAFKYLVNPSVCYGFSPNYFMTCNVSFVKVFVIIIFVWVVFLSLISTIIVLCILLYRSIKKSARGYKAMVLNTEY